MPREQVQKLKLDTESAMLELDQILRANEMTVALVAAVPSFLIAGGTLYALARWVTPSPPDRRREALPARSGSFPLGSRPNTPYGVHGNRACLSVAVGCVRACGVADLGSPFWQIWQGAACLSEDLA